MNKKPFIPFSKPFALNYPAVEKKLGEILKSPYWTKGKYVDIFEENCKKYLGVKYAVAVSSCTSGLILTLASIKKTGEVILPGFSFPAIANAIIWNGLKPVFVDVDPVYGNIDPFQVEKAISKKTVAILPVCNYGFPPEFDKLEKIAKQNNLPLITDSAQSFGAIFKGKKCGGFGSAEVFSLSPSKIITAAEGGIIATNQKKLADFVRKGRNYGKSEDELFYFAGLSCRLSEFHSILGIEMLKNINKIIKYRTLLAKKYYNELMGTPSISLPSMNSKIKPSFNYFVIFVHSRRQGKLKKKIIEALHEKGIEARPYFYPPVYKHPAFKDFAPKKMGLENCEKLASQAIALPFYPDMKFKDIEIVCNIIKKVE